MAAMADELWRGDAAAAAAEPSAEAPDLLPLLAVHAALRRDLARLHTALHSVQVRDRNRLAALAVHWRFLARATAAYLDVRDRLLLALVRARMPHLAVLVDRLADDAVPLYGLVASGADRCAEAARAGALSRERLLGLAGAAAETVNLHLDAVEAHLVPLLRSVLTQGEMETAFEAMRAETGDSGTLLLPWLAEGLDAETTTRLLGAVSTGDRAAFRMAWRPGYARLAERLWGS